MPITEHRTQEIARLNFRLPPEVKERIERAAIASGLTTTDFAIHALTSTADEVLERHNTRTLSDRDRDLFLSMLDNPPKPGKTLREAAERYKKLVKD